MLTCLSRPVGKQILGPFQKQQKSEFGTLSWLKGGKSTSCWEVLFFLAYKFGDLGLNLIDLINDFSELLSCHLEAQYAIRG